MNIVLDKIASVTKNVKLTKEVHLNKKINCEEGAVIAVEVLEDKKIYNELELPSARMSIIHKGDILAVALGNRSALKGFVGVVPKKLKVGDIINVLNLGGVSGICLSENFKEFGHALKVRVLGAITKGGKNVNIRDYKIFSPKKKLEKCAPLIVVSGTCMNVGKTGIACEIAKQATRKGLKIYATKLAGVAALKDTEKMRDYGAKEAVTFIDAGVTSTAKTNSDSVAVTKGAINYLSKGKPDYIVIEFGDGVFGEYGVMEILKDKEIQKNIIVHIGAAHDPMGASKLVEVCKEIGAPLDLISGPVTDNSVGVNFVEKNLKVKAINALTQGEKMFTYLYKKCLKK